MLFPHGTIRSLGMAAIIVGHLGLAEVSAEARYNEAGTTIDPEIWMEEATIDPLSYFVVGCGKKSQGQKNPESAVVEFFEIFNNLVEKGVLDALDVRIVWSMRDSPTNCQMIDNLCVARNTFFGRLCKIRSVLRNAYGIQ